MQQGPALTPEFNNETIGGDATQLTPHAALHPSRSQHQICSQGTVSTPCRHLRRLYEAWQRSDPLRDVSEAFCKSFPGSSPEQDSLTHNGAILLGGGQMIAGGNATKRHLYRRA